MWIKLAFSSCGIVHSDGLHCGKTAKAFLSWLHISSENVLG